MYSLLGAEERSSVSMDRDRYVLYSKLLATWLAGKTTVDCCVWVELVTVSHLYL